MLPIRKRGWALGRRGPGGLSGTVMIGLSVFTWAANAAEPPIVPPLAQTERGRETFVRQWKAGDSHAPAGDGLGPMFNAQSCADCHNLGSLGGGGKNKNNVDLLSVILPANKEKIDRAEVSRPHDEISPGIYGRDVVGAAVHHAA